MIGSANDVRGAAMAAAQDPGLGIVWFAGGGGSSEGLREAGYDPDYALNHNGTALAMHQVNHPACVHLCDDAMANHPETLEPGRRVRWFWASPDCTHFSVARGSAPKSPRIRGLAWCIVDWAEQRRPEVIFVENVKEFTTWGPLDDAGQPIRDRSGETFRKWVSRLEAAGYVVEWRVLCAADYGAPTTRRRLFVMARCDGQPIVWPERTHAPRKDAAALGLKPYASAASIIDWSEDCPSIFMSQAEAKGRGLKVKRPLVKATLNRVAKGLKKYVIGSGEPFIVPILNTTWSPDRVDASSEPLRTITAAKGGEFAVAAPTLAMTTKFQENSIGQHPAEPLDTVMAGATRFGVVETAMRAAPLMVGAAYGDGRPGAGLRAWSAEDPVRTITGGGNGGFNAATAYLVPSYGEAPGQQPRAGSVEAPYPTVVQNGNGGHLVAATLGRQFGSNVSGADIQEAMPTIMGEGGGGKMQVIAANLTTYYGTGLGSEAGEPLRTVTGEDRHGVVSAFLEQANTGSLGHDAREALSTVTGRGTQQRLIEARLQAIGAAPDSRRRAVLQFLWDHFGEPTEAEWADPTATDQGRLRFGLVILSGQVWEIADIGMRMLKPRELFSAQGFRPDYIIDRDPWGNAINGTAATLMVGNSVPPPLARVLAAANLTLEPQPERLAA